MNNIVTMPTTAAPRKVRPWLWWVAGLVLLLLVAAGAMIAYMSYVPDDLDYSTTRLTEQGMYEVSYTAQVTPVPVNQMLTWTLHVETAAGQVVENATITVDGDMPQHGHGLPTRPQVTRYLGNGDYVVEGLKFHMPGWWVMDFVITKDGQSDQVHFNMQLK
jgi:YtkA-like protein